MGLPSNHQMWPAHLILNFFIDVIQQLIKELVPRQVAEEAVADVSSSRVQAVAKAILALEIRQHKCKVLRHHATPEGMGGRTEGKGWEGMGEGWEGGEDRSGE